MVATSTCAFCSTRIAMAFKLSSDEGRWNCFQLLVLLPNLITILCSDVSFDSVATRLSLFGSPCTELYMFAFLQLISKLLKLTKVSESCRAPSSKQFISLLRQSRRRFGYFKSLLTLLFTEQQVSWIDKSSSSGSERKITSRYDDPCESSGFLCQLEP